MNKRKDLDNPVKFKPDYKWPKVGTVKNCPKCDAAMQLQPKAEEYYGKPWWCYGCQWQFSEEDLA